MQRKVWGFQSEERYPCTVKHGGGSIMNVGVFCCKRVFLKHHKQRGLSRNMMVKTSAGKVKIACNWVLQQDNSIKHASKALTKWLKDNKDVKELEWPAQSPDLNPKNNCVLNLKRKKEKRMGFKNSKEAYNPDWVTPDLSGKMGKDCSQVLLTNSELIHVKKTIYQILTLSTKCM